MVALIALGRDEEARKVAARVLSINPRIRDRPHIGLEHMLRESRDFVDRAIEMLRDTDPA